MKKPLPRFSGCVSCIFNYLIFSQNKKIPRFLLHIIYFKYLPCYLNAVGTRHGANTFMSVDHMDRLMILYLESPKLEKFEFDMSVLYVDWRTREEGL